MLLLELSQDSPALEHVNNILENVYKAQFVQMLNFLAYVDNFTQHTIHLFQLQIVVIAKALAEFGLMISDVLHLISCSQHVHIMDLEMKTVSTQKMLLCPAPQVYQLLHQVSAKETNAFAPSTFSIQCI